MFTVESTAAILTSLVTWQVNGQVVSIAGVNFVHMEFAKEPGFLKKNISSNLIICFSCYVSFKEIIDVSVIFVVLSFLFVIFVFLIEGFFEV